MTQGGHGLSFIEREVGPHSLNVLFGFMILPKLEQLRCLTPSSLFFKKIIPDILQA